MNDRKNDMSSMSCFQTDQLDLFLFDLKVCQRFTVTIRWPENSELYELYTGSPFNIFNESSKKQAQAITVTLKFLFEASSLSRNKLSFFAVFKQKKKIAKKSFIIITPMNSLVGLNLNLGQCVHS